MQVMIKNSSGITMVPIDTMLLSERRVSLTGEIDSDMACQFKKEILYLNHEDPGKRIDVLINTPGGEMNAGLLIYDIIQSSPAPIRMICCGRAYSMGAVLFASGGHGRYMFPHSRLMIHEPLLGNLVGGNTSSIRSVSDSLLEAEKMLNRILAKHTGKTEKEIEDASSYDHYFTAEESIGFGLCDGIIGLDKVLEE